MHKYTHEVPTPSLKRYQRYVLMNMQKWPNFQRSATYLLSWPTSILEAKQLLCSVHAHIEQSGNNLYHQTCPLTSPLQEFIQDIPPKTSDLLTFPTSTIVTAIMPAEPTSSKSRARWLAEVFRGVFRAASGALLQKKSRGVPRTSWQDGRHDCCRWKGHFCIFMRTYLWYRLSDGVGTSCMYLCII